MRFILWNGWSTNVKELCNGCWIWWKSACVLTQNSEQYQLQNRCKTVRFWAGVCCVPPIPSIWSGLFWYSQLPFRLLRSLERWELVIQWRCNYKKTLKKCVLYCKFRMCLDPWMARIILGPSRTAWSDWFWWTGRFIILIEHLYRAWMTPSMTTWFDALNQTPRCSFILHDAVHELTGSANQTYP